ncbi:hypothetical protein DEI83_09280 [Curtobacterium sp. MCBD17_021]|nr:hypothetical protein DEI83_09280 [Curtobacterium sp. MCBD17_021]
MVRRRLRLPRPAAPVGPARRRSARRPLRRSRVRRGRSSRSVLPRRAAPDDSLRWRPSHRPRRRTRRRRRCDA